MPWEPGQSGNPGGRSSRNDYIKKAAQEHGPKSLETLVKMLSSRDDKVKVVAAQALLDRGYGKSTEYKIIENRTVFDDMSLDELARRNQELIERIERLQNVSRERLGAPQAGIIQTVQ